MNYLIIAIFCILMLMGLILAIISAIKNHRELNQIKEEQKKEEAERKRKDEAKEKLHTGDPSTDFNNSIEQLSKLKNK